MSTPESAVGTTGRTTQEQTPTPQEPSMAGSVMLPNLLPPDWIVAELSAVPTTQPIAALAAANQHQSELVDVFLQAVERGVQNPTNDLKQDGILFNYAGYFLAKWRERRASPLFLRWFSLPGEQALDLGGDTIAQSGARLLASVWNGVIEPMNELMLNRAAHPICRGQAITALGVLVAWGEYARSEAGSTLLFLAREGLERTPGPVWNDLALLCARMEFLPLFAELRQAQQDGLIGQASINAEDLQQIEQAPRGALVEQFTRSHPPITDVITETRWWAGFHEVEQASAQPFQTQISSPPSPKVGRNDPCPCGSGKKYKKCCGA